MRASAGRLWLRRTRAERRKEQEIRRPREDHMNKLTKWNPLKLSPSWDPFREMEEMHNRLSSLFGRSWPVWRSEPEEGFTLAEWMPPVDIEESDKEYLIKAELPGVKKEEVKLEVEGGTLSISGERKAEKEEKDKKYRLNAATARFRVASRCRKAP